MFRMFHPSGWVIVGLTLLAACGCGGAPANTEADAGGIDLGAVDGGGEDGAAIVRLRGGVQKGPFILGSSVSISPIDAVGNPTGAVFGATTFNDLGEFAVDFSYLGPVSLEATGFYYNEETGALSGAPLTLRAYHEVSSGGAQAAYVNLITHLTYGRVRELVLAGSAVADATVQAEDELRTELGIGPAGFTPDAPGIYLNQLGGDNDSSAYLLAVSAVLSRAGLLRGGDAGLQELLNIISTDLGADGLLHEPLKSEINSAHRTVDGDRVLSSFRARLAAIGSDAVVPDIHRMLDTDGDGIVNASDNCRSVPNPTQADRDGDIWGGDACDNDMLETTAHWSAMDFSVVAMAWGDVDGDGDVDLATGAGGLAPSNLYRNDGGRLTTTATWSSADGGESNAVAWADVDRDGDLDLAVGGGRVRLYRNDGGTLTTVAVWSGGASVASLVVAMAWGDVDRDGDADLAVIGESGGCGLFRNDGGVLGTDAVWNSTLEGAPGWGRSLAWGDVDGDGDLDLAAGAYYVLLYRNDGGALTNTAVWTSADPAPGSGGWVAAFGDVDGDGDVDLATSSHLYRNDAGALSAAAVWTSPAASGSTRCVAWGDVDEDGDVDLAVGGDGSGSVTDWPVVYRGDGVSLTAASVWTALGGGASVAWGDPDGDGDLDLAAGSSLYISRLR